MVSRELHQRPVAAALETVDFIQIFVYIDAGDSRVYRSVHTARLGTWSATTASLDWTGGGANLKHAGKPHIKEAKSGLKDYNGSFIE